jgi:hypothetical protein
LRILQSGSSVTSFYSDHNGKNRGKQNREKITLRIETLYWELSQRGGRFVFEVRKIKENKTEKKSH